jgi:HSP20 family protein
MVWDWDPFEYFQQMRKEMERAFGTPIAQFGQIRPAVANVYETESGVIAEFELPGVDKKEVQVQITSAEAVVRVERKTEKRSERKSVYRQEARALSFYRRVSFPVEIVPEKARAQYHNGILRIEAPKAKADRKGVRTLPIE